MMWINRWHTDAVDILKANILRQHDLAYNTDLFYTTPGVQEQTQEWDIEGVPWNLEDVSHQHKILRELGVVYD